MLTTTLINNELQEMKRIHNRCQKRSASLNCRSLHTRFEHGKPRPYTLVNGKPKYIARDEKYAAKNLHKLLRYFQCDYLPYIDLVVTYDKNGTLDMTQVEQIIAALNL